ncbi:GIY-YIG nuclease family protein [Bradyrhizobium ottawaense]|uniref:GIY-YIG nuclease family protein n=2 Tax=Bradyrhizobium TaxID=374 RepID=A0A939RWG8_9BRAD|nr:MULTISPECIES: GIY-YIG nuclease family protein [Bradyrhizobium]AWL92113.1 GIY-YIG nuclease family protein [Bradyrhizobium ottawaense]UEM13652.1 GIY-YIG nuclease family protein [Bradyrhizobium barranii subsp. barranii]
MPKPTLDDLLSGSDPLLDVKPAAIKAASSEQQRILDTFVEVNKFIDHHKHKPGDTEKPSVSERALRMKLNGLLNDPAVHDMLLPHDRHALLPVAPVKPPQTLDEIFDDDLLKTPQDDIFDLVHVKPAVAKPDEIAERQLCAEFDKFKPLFEQCVREMTDGKRKAIPFANEQEIRAGEFFILNGVLVYVAEVGETHIRNGKKNARLRLIFDNGTEGNNLLRSLATELYKDPNGRRITTTDMGPLFTDTPAAGDAQTGMIYVVKSLSDDPEIRKLDGALHKIGFTSGKMEIRIQNAKDDPTFLMAPVHPVTTYTLYNIDRVKLEHLLHDFFASARLDIEITDRFGQKVRPREWFLVPSFIIGEAVARLKDGSIVNYFYDRDAGALVPIAIKGD